MLDFNVANIRNSLLSCHIHRSLFFEWITSEEHEQNHYICDSMPKALNILFSPLDWGLGHASRSVSILKYLEEEGHHLTIGVNEISRRFLQDHIPSATFTNVPSYRINYGKGNSFFSYVGLSNRIWKAKREEEKWVKDFVSQNQVDLIISDSRFGFRHSQIKSIIISHQLSLQFPKFWRLPGKLAQYINQQWLSAFDEIWVPDGESREISGELSRNPDLKAQFIGILSRFENKEYPKPVDGSYVLCILSGPEPQRSILEEKIINQSFQLNHQLIIVGGQPNKDQSSYELSNIKYFTHLPTAELATYIQHADLVISRSGYSSLMDYVTLGCKSVFLIPTPDQPEQIYLAKRMKESGICDFAFQDDFHLAEAFNSKGSFSGFFTTMDTKDTAKLKKSVFTLN